MSVFNGTSVKGDQFLGSINPVANGILRLAFPNQNAPPASRVGYYYVFAINPSAPQRAYVIDSGLLHTPGLAVNYGTSILTPEITMQVRATWNFSGFLWQLTIT